MGIQPINFTEIQLRIDGVDCVVGGMARPDFNEVSIHECMKYLNERNFNLMIGLQPEVRYNIIAHIHKIKYIKRKVEDFYPPEIALFEEVFDRVKLNITARQNSTVPPSKIVIHCGEGFGRTGTVLAALKLKELMLEPSIGHKQEETEVVSLTYGADMQTAPCTPLVKLIIETIRGIYGHNNAVETISQVQRLCEYHNYLFHQGLALTTASGALDLLDGISHQSACTSHMSNDEIRGDLMAPTKSRRGFPYFNPRFFTTVETHIAEDIDLRAYPEGFVA